MTIVLNGTSGITTPPVSVEGSTSGTITLAAPAVAGTNTQTLVAATGTLAPLIAGTAVASTSGTSIDFTSIPSWVKRITVMFSGVSTNGISLVEVRLGTSSGFVATGYLGASGNLSSGAVGSTSSSTGMRTDNIGSASLARNGVFSCVLLTANTWCSSSIMADSTTALLGFAGSSIALAGVLDRVRITTVNGTDTFDAGTINILYE
jgi:hypothetical protein